MYNVYLHGISDRTCDTVTDAIANKGHCRMDIKDGETLERSTRISLTIRHVPKVLKAKLFLSKR